MTDFYATLVIAAKFFKNRTHFNNSKFLINPTRPRCFLNEYQMLISPAIQYNSFQRVHVSRKLSKSLINMTNFYATLDIAAKFFKNRTHFNDSRFLIMCYKNTKNTPNIDFNRIPRQNTHSHIILKHQSPNYYYDSANINVTIKTTISNNRNEIAMIFNPLTTWRAFFGRNWPGDWARELFKPFTDSASLLVEIEKKRFLFRVWGFLEGTSQVGVFLCYFGHLCLALGDFPMGHFLDTMFSWKLGQDPRL